MTSTRERPVSEIVNSLDRNKIQLLLESYGFAVYDSESTDELREALRVNVEDGTIPKTLLEGA